MIRGFARNLSALLLLAPCTLASTWVVDDNGGPGVHFTSITAAIAAGAPGDIILVRPGNYAGFTLGYAARILGTPAAAVTSPVSITGVPAGSRATLASLSLRTLSIQNCVAPVTIEDVSFSPSTADLQILFGGIVRISGCSDVRLRHVTVPPTVDVSPTAIAVYVTASRVEISGSTLTGGRGLTCGFSYPGWAQPGAPALFAVAGSNLRVATSTLTGGGGGGAGAVECQSDSGGDGSAAIELWRNASAIVSGTAADMITGGQFGYAGSCNNNGAPGNGILVDLGTLRVSGAIVTGASPAPGCGPPAQDIVGPYTQPMPADPTVVCTGIPSPGQALYYRLHGAPGDTGQLVFGRQLAIADVPNVVEDQLLVPVWTVDLGVFPPNGELVRLIGLPLDWPVGNLIVAQGRTTSPTGVVSLTHSVPITLR